MKKVEDMNQSELMTQLKGFGEVKIHDRGRTDPSDRAYLVTVVTPAGERAFASGGPRGESNYLDDALRLALGELIKEFGPIQ